MSNHDHSVDQHEDGPESAQLAAVKSIQTERARREANPLRDQLDHYVAKLAAVRAARNEMTNTAALFLSVYGQHEPTTDFEAAAEAALKAIFKRGTE